MSMESVVSKIAYDELEEKSTYNRRRAEIHVGDKVTRMELDEDGNLKINGKYSDTPVLPKKADKIVLY